MALDYFDAQPFHLSTAWRCERSVTHERCYRIILPGPATSRVLLFLSIAWAGVGEAVIAKASLLHLSAPPAESTQVIGAVGGRMPRTKLQRMDVKSLLQLRQQIEELLEEHRAELQQQLAKLDDIGPASSRGGVKARKVPPKYRSRSGETWAGRGARPRWLVAELKRGKKLESFLIR